MALATFVLATTLLSGAINSAEADTFVVFGDSNLRATVARQLVKQGQLPAGSDGTTMAPSDIETLTALSARSKSIVRLDGLRFALNLTSLDLAGNEVSDIAELSGLSFLAQLDVTGNNLDMTAGSPARSVITTLQARGAHVSYRPQRARLSRLAVSSSASKYGRSVTFSAGIAPRAAAVSGTSKVLLYHLETKTVTRKIKGKKKRVAVNYWRLRRSLTMRVSATKALSVKGKLPYAGKWQGRVAYGGSSDYVSCKSSAIAFTVQDPRIQAAINWAMRRRGAHTWDHYCLRFVCDCYARGAHASVHRYGSARQAARVLHASAHREANAPRGALVFYDSTAGGHVGISLGNGTMINDFGSSGVKIMRIKAGGHYVGWAAPPLSPPIADWKKPPKR